MLVGKDLFFQSKYYFPQGREHCHGSFREVSATRLSCIIEQKGLVRLRQGPPSTPRINVDLISRLPIRGTLYIFGLGIHSLGT